MSQSTNGTTTTLVTTALDPATAPAPTATTCAVCKDPISNSPDPWDNGWRCARGCRCVMIGCVPLSPRPVEQQAVA